jgi:hypothetical protein
MHNALRTAATLTKEARHYNRKRLAKQANANIFKTGDFVVLKANEPLTLTSTWDPHWIITKIRNKVVWITHQQTGKQKVVNVSKVKLVDPNIIWDELNPRPIRNQRLGNRIATDPPQHQPGNVSKQATADAQTSQRMPNVRQGAQPARSYKRRRDDSQSSEESHLLKEAPPRLTATSSQDDQRCTPPAASSTRQPAITRTAPERSDDHKKLHRQALRRPHQEEADQPAKRPPPNRGYVRPLADPVFPEAKRTRPILPRAAKRALTAPDEDTQKRAKLEAIALVRRCSLL